MIEVTGNLWDYPATYRVITTNGTVRKNGTAVMGRGCAREAALKYHGLAHELGKMLKEHGNHVHFFAQLNLLTFPVKHAFYEDADLQLIARSVEEFKMMVAWLSSSGTYVMPRPGCGWGHLDWTMVQPLLLDLPDTVKVIHFGESVL